MLLPLAFATTATAGPPSHPQKADPIGGFALNHACGTAADLAGDLYVSNAGEGRIEIFDSSGTYLTSILNANEPCGLAVDGHGTLFVTEKGTGNVVRYVPDDLPPFTGTPTYDPVEELDASGDAAGIAVDSSILVTNNKEPIGQDDSLFIAKGDKVDAYRNERQGVRIEGAAGTYTLEFDGDVTDPINYNAGHEEVQEALEDLPSIGAGNVSITTANFATTDHLITFIGNLGLTNVPELVVDTTNLTGSFNQTETPGGFAGPLAEDPLAEYTGVAAYTYQRGSSEFTRYLYVADATGNTVQVFSGESLASLKARKTIEGPKDGEDFGFGPAGAYLTVDRGNSDPKTTQCDSIAEQACTAGHLLVYDAAHNVVDEFDATGEFLDQIVSGDFADAEPTALAVERSGGPADGTIYVTAGSGPGAKLLAFGPLVAPSRPPLPGLSQVLADAQAVATDPYGNVYVASGPNIHVFDADGDVLTTIPDSSLPYDLAVDSECNVYVLDGGPQSSGQMTYYDSPVCPPAPGTSFARHEPSVVDSSGLKGIAVSPNDDHVFLFGGGSSAPIVEFGPPPGSTKIRECGAGLSGLGNTLDLAVYGNDDGDGSRVYLSLNPGRLIVIDCATEGVEEVIAETRGGGCPSGQLGASPAIAVDQSNGHVLEFDSGQTKAREYDASGACVAEFGTFNNNAGAYGIAIDNGVQSPNKGTVYVAFDGLNNAVQPFDVTAFGPLSYGENPIALTGVADGVGGGDATLRGTVDPRGFELLSCEFEYLLDSEYEENSKTFAGATSVPCAETAAEIGNGSGAVSVHANLAGLEANERYRFRLLAKNRFGESAGDAWLFGPPRTGGEEAQPVLYDEAVLRAEVDPSGLATQYHFEYGTSEAYGQSTPMVTLPPGDGPVAIEAPLSGLAEGTLHHFRLVVANEVNDGEGLDHSFETQEKLQGATCPNNAYRTGLSAKLSECRAYEVVTPGDTGIVVPGPAGPPSAGLIFNNWLVAPRGPGAGESLAYFAGTLPGFEGTGGTDGYRATRSPGGHPSEGWQTEFYGPSYAQLGGGVGGNSQEGVSADQRYWLWTSRVGALLPAGQYVRVPEGTANPVCNINPETFQDEFELVACGSKGTDPQAESRFVSPGGEHIVFFSDKQLEAGAAPDGTQSIYDREAGEASAEVVSVDPDGNPFGANASYVGASEDGSTILFSVGATLYAHRGGETFEIVSGPHTFAGISEDGARVFYIEATFIGDPSPASLYACDLGANPCTLIAEDSIFTGISPDGSHAFFTSEGKPGNVLPDSEPNENGEESVQNQPNLYAWDGSSTRFVAILAADDFVSFGGVNVVDLLAWTRSVNAGQNIGRANAPTRATPDGGVFVFQSHARLSDYDNKGKGQIYRFEPAAPVGERLLCVSCDPAHGAVSADAMLQIYDGEPGGNTLETTLIPNVTDDGEAVFFNSPEPLVPEDANDVVDVYEWRAQGAGGSGEECKRAAGCLSLISSGQGERQSTLYGMSADGHDVFFSTSERLVGADVSDTSSIYDARVEGGIPDPPLAAPCQGDACQGQGSTPPNLAAPASTAPLGTGDVRPKGRVSHCAKGKRKVKHKGKVRCVKKRAKHEHPGRRGTR